MLVIIYSITEVNAEMKNLIERLDFDQTLLAKRKEEIIHIEDVHYSQSQNFLRVSCMPNLQAYLLAKFD